MKTGRYQERDPSPGDAPRSHSLGMAPPAPLECSCRSPNERQLFVVRANGLPFVFILTACFSRKDLGFDSEDLNSGPSLRSGRQIQGLPPRVILRTLSLVCPRARGRGRNFVILRSAATKNLGLVPLPVVLTVCFSPDRDRAAPKRSGGSIPQQGVPFSVILSGSDRAASPEGEDPGWLLKCVQTGCFKTSAFRLKRIEVQKLTPDPSAIPPVSG